MSDEKIKNNVCKATKNSVGLVFVAILSLFIYYWVVSEDQGVIIFTWVITPILMGCYYYIYRLACYY